MEPKASQSNTCSSFSPIFSIVPHTVFFWLRVAGFCTILMMSMNAVGLRHRCTTISTQSRKLEALDDFIFLTQFNIFELYMVVSSIASNNIYGYYFSIVVMVHNALLTMLVATFSAMYRTWRFLVVHGLVSLLFVLEALFTICLVYQRRFCNNLELFRKVGASPRINDAFFIRKILQTFGTVNVFSASVSAGKDLATPLVRFDGVSFLGYGFSLITYLQQVLISVNFNSENLAQRKAAIFVSCIKIPLAASVIVWSSTSSTHVTGRTQESTIYIFSDILVITVIMIYYLVRDTQYFGSGIKEYLQCRTRRFDLSSTL